MSLGCHGAIGPPSARGRSQVDSRVLTAERELGGPGGSELENDLKKSGKILGVLWVIPGKIG